MKLIGILSLLGLCLLHFPKRAECRHGDFRFRLVRSGVPCAVVASHGASFLDHVLASLPIVERQRWTGLLDRFTGVDLTNHSEMERVVCRVLEASSTEQLKNILDDLDVTFSMARFAYDAGALALLLTLEWLPAAGPPMGPGSEGDYEHRLQLSGLGLLESVYDTGFLGLDPEGVRLAQGVMMIEDDGSVPFAPEVTRSCDHVMMPFDAFMDLLIYNNPYPERGEAARRLLESWIGINLADSEALHGFVCDLLESSDVYRLYDVLDSSGVLGAALAAGYDEAVRTAYNYRRGLQYAVDQLEELETVVDVETEWEYADRHRESLERQAAAAGVYFPLLESLEQSGCMNLA